MQILYPQEIFTIGFWSLERQVKHQDLKTLFNNLHNTIINSRAKNTVSKYIGSFKRYMFWVENYKEIDSVLPSSELHVALYLQYLMGTVKYHSTIESAFYGIKWAHNTAGLSDPCEADIVRSIVEASKRELNRRIKKNEPLTADLMKLLFLKFNTVNYTLKELLVICALSYTGFLRYDELSNIKVNNITFHEEYVDIFIEKSKTNCYRNGKNV